MTKASRLVSKAGIQMILINNVKKTSKTRYLNLVFPQKFLRSIE